MIRQKKNRQNFQKESKKIALVGTKKGVGVTHIGIILAEFLNENIGANVAFIEKNHHGHFEKIEQEIFSYSRSVFSFHGVDYYKEIEYEKIGDMVQNSYEYLILDFGVQKKKNQEEIEQCDEKILVGKLNFWEWQEYIQAVYHFKKGFSGQSKKYVVNFGNEKMINRMRKILKEKIYFLGHQPIELAISKNIEEFFYTLL